MKHTLGPWAIRDDDEDGVVSIVGDSQIVLARVRTATAEPGDENARLSLLRAELLEALEALYEATIAMDVTNSDLSSVLEAEAALAQSRAAIAKATGEKQ